MKSKYGKRILSFVLCAVLLLAFSACTQGEEGEVAPDGMQFATAAGADYRLYIPTHWSVNVDYGVSGGYYSLGTQSTVSAQKYPITEEMRDAMPGEGASNAKARADWFYEQSLKPLVASLASGGLETVDVNCVAVLLDGVNARQYHVTATIKDVKLQFVHVVGERKDAFYVIALTVADELYVNLKEDFATIRDAFVFSDTPYAPTETMKELPADENTPDGMQAASNSDVAYGFYVPASWRVDRNHSIFAAVAPDGSSSVSVVPYLPHSDEQMSVKDYFDWNRANLKKTSPEGYTDVSEKEITLDGVPAMQYEYTYTVGGRTYCYLQVVAAWRGMFYNLTYTALPENYESNLGDVQRIIEAFDFR
ncbi:MAG: DUF1795 domain-containing protein [Ruminococcaceae bacterium]|nr:DUF1795 domain-containing protein [Oscillospiraceae bacterium]